MAELAALVADPAWLPHRIDFAARRVLFLRFEREDLSRPGFLADREASALQAWMPLDDYAAVACDRGPIHFIFHTGFCRSTLLARALGASKAAVGLNEPGILNSLVDAGEAGRPLLRPTLDLLARPRPGGEAVLVKPSNYANELIEPILLAAPEAKAVLLTSPLAGFLERVARKGLHGELWGRQVFLKLLPHAGRDLGIDMRAVAAMADMQAAGLAWFLHQRMFADLLKGPLAPRLRSLEGDRFNRCRAATLAAAAEFFDLQLDQAEARALAEGPVFRANAKGGGDFAEVEARATQRGISAVVKETIATVEQWIGKLARQIGQPMPVPQTLL